MQDGILMICILDLVLTSILLYINRTDKYEDS